LANNANAAASNGMAPHFLFWLLHALISMRAFSVFSTFFHFGGLCFFLDFRIFRPSDWVQRGHHSGLARALANLRCSGAALVLCAA